MPSAIRVIDDIGELLADGFSVGEYPQWNGSKFVGNNPAASPGGSNAQIQYNNSGAFAGSATKITSDGRFGLIGAPPVTDEIFAIDYTNTVSGTSGNPYVVMDFSPTVIGNHSLYGFYFAPYFTPSTNISTFAVINAVATYAGGAANTVTNMYGGNYVCSLYGGKATNMYGQYNELRYNLTPGNVTNAYGSYNWFRHFNRGKSNVFTKVSLYDGVVTQSDTTVTITTLYGFELSGWTNSGTINTSYGLYIDSSTGVGTTHTGIFVSSGKTTGKGIVVKGVASQSANLQEWQDSSENILFAIEADGDIRTSKSSAGTSLGSVTNKLPIYNAAGTLIGYIPIYDAIT